MRLRGTRKGQAKKPFWYPTLSNNVIQENNAPNAVVGILKTVDEDNVDLTYSIIDGDVSAFNINGNELRLSQQLNFEIKSIYSVTVRATDSNGLFYDSSFNISITNEAERPTEIFLSNNSITEYNEINADIGILSVSKPSSQPVIYTIVDGDVSAFNINGDKLKASASYRYATKNSYSVTVRADSGGEFFDKTFNISIIDYSYTYTGRIINSSTNAGISQATVTFYTAQNGTLLASTTTDLSGYYSVVFESSGSYFVTVTASGYNNWEGTINTDLTSSISISPAIRNFQIRWKGGQPYSYSGVNRIWDMTFTEGSSRILVECRQITAKNSTGTGNAIWTKSATAFLTGSATPNNSDAFIIDCTTNSPVFTATTISSDPGDASFTPLLSSGSNIDESAYEVNIGITFNFCGTGYNSIGISSNSYVVFGSSSFTLPAFVFSAASPAYPGIGVCADPTASGDTNVVFVGYRVF